MVSDCFCEAFFYSYIFSLPTGLLQPPPHEVLATDVVNTMIQNFGGNGLSYYGVWFELHQADFLWFELPQADLPHGLNPWGVV